MWSGTGFAKDVRSIGQGFADEVFRVFAAAHPDTKPANPMDVRLAGPYEVPSLELIAQ